MNLNRKDIRPLIEGINVVKNKSPEEIFQNLTLRPVIKMQHELLLAYFGEYLRSKKCKFKDLRESGRQDYIGKAFRKDIGLKLELKGMIIGQFTTEEFADYIKNKSEYNKRILSMVQQRIISVKDSF